MLQSDKKPLLYVTVDWVSFCHCVFDPDYHFSELQCTAASVCCLILSKQWLFWCSDYRRTALETSE